jgi:hypothetical protein
MVETAIGQSLGADFLNAVLMAQYQDPHTFLTHRVCRTISKPRTPRVFILPDSSTVCAARNIRTYSFASHFAAPGGKDREQLSPPHFPAPE